MSTDADRNSRRNIFGVLAANLPLSKSINGSTRIISVLPIAILGISSTLYATTPAQTHSAPSGWAYPYQCCHDQDCRPVEGAAITEGPNGYVINGTGEVVGYMDSRIKASPDGEYHWCSVAGKEKSSTICLFVPPRAF